MNAIRTSPARRGHDAYLGIAGVLGGLVKGGGGEIMLLPRRRNALVERGRRGGADVLVGAGEVGRLHGGRLGAVLRTVTAAFTGSQ